MDREVTDLELRSLQDPPGDVFGDGRLSGRRAPAFLPGKTPPVPRSLRQRRHCFNKLTLPGETQAVHLTRAVHLARGLVVLFPLTTTSSGSGASHTASPPKPVDALESYLETWHGADRFAESVQLQQQPNPMWRQEGVEDGHVRGYASCGRAVRFRPE